MTTGAPEVRVVLVCHAGTRAMRQARFGIEDALDARGRAEAAALRGRLPEAGGALAGPCLAAFQTASLAGCAPVRTEPALADCDYGAWQGRTLEEVERDDGAALAAWETDPTATPHAGESMHALLGRVAQWLDGSAERPETVVTVVAGAVVKAAVVHALQAPPTMLHRLEVGPASLSELLGRPGRWTVTRVNQSVAIDH